MNDLTPLILDPIIVPKTWGGRRLEVLGKTVPAFGTYGESWEVADLPSEVVSGAGSSRSPVATGVHAGMTLRSLIDTHGADFLGSAAATPSGDFPLLVKLLDAKEALSVQVHPTADYVADHPGSWLKTESWYIIDAELGAVIYKGLKVGVEVGDVRSAAGTAALVSLVNDVAAIPGAFHHLPAGMIHALGAGVLIAEVQSPSDTTFRLYDWTEEFDRPPRALHLTEGLDSLVMHPSPVVASPMSSDGERLLIDTNDYWLREHRKTDGLISIDPDRELRILMVVRGAALVSGPGASKIELACGATTVIPAAVAEDISVELLGSATVLEIGLVSRSYPEARG